MGTLKQSQQRFTEELGKGFGANGLQKSEILRTEHDFGLVLLVQLKKLPWLLTKLLISYKENLLDSTFPTSHTPRILVISSLFIFLLMPICKQFAKVWLLLTITPRSSSQGKQICEDEAEAEEKRVFLHPQQVET
ncbi:hypothetical protein OWV82_014071 [Melia azedarach]|uniref:Uncharacterized protein n=1 Tax=Melia azedarach TaxID=155640 RepID=A0ACC1XX78_MELAZ|nr:hypothetical protein OWV82_014071 [Melia azedarach]